MIGNTPAHPFRWDAVRLIVRHTYLILGTILWVYLFAVLAPQMGTFGADAIAYYSAEPPLYDIEYGAFRAFAYSPVFYQVVSPLQELGWVGFAWIWGAINVATAVWLGPLALAFPATPVEIYLGNVHLIIGAATVLGLRHPWAWTFVLATKATCGVGLLWFIARREWRQLGVAAAATTAVFLISFVVAPDLWQEYAQALLTYASSEPATGGLALHVPFLARLPVAAVLVIWGARHDYRWVVPIAALLALPVLWLHGFAILAAIPLAARRTSGASRSTWSGRGSTDGGSTRSWR